MPAELYLDASFAIALASSGDQYHTRAVELARRIEAQQSRLVTTAAVALEIGNALAKLRYRQAAVNLLTSLHADPSVQVVPLSESLYVAGLDLYRNRPDKEWGLTDCISFTLMHERGITDALSADMHFRQAGFRPLLVDPI